MKNAFLEHCSRLDKDKKSIAFSAQITGVDLHAEKHIQLTGQLLFRLQISMNYLQTIWSVRFSPYK